MPVAFDRNICCDLNETVSREWLVTNGLGGYAAGTVAGVLTRMEHGLLVASLRDVAAPQLLVAKIDEEIAFDQRTYYLGTNEYQDGTFNPAGFVHLETFHLEEGFPVFRYRLGGIDGIMLEKRIWMPYGYNTTYIQYRVLPTRTDSDSTALPYGNNGQSTWRGSNKGFEGGYSGYSGYADYPEAAQRTLALTLLPFSAYRPHQQPQHGNNDRQFQVRVHSTEWVDDMHTPMPKGVAGCTIQAMDEAPSYSVLAVGHPDSQVTFIPTGVWYWNFLHRHDRTAGRPALDDLYLPGVIRSKLWPGEDSTLTIIVTAEEPFTQTFSPSQLNLSYQRSVEHQQSVLQPQRYFGEGGQTAYYLHTLPLPSYNIDGEEFLRLLLQAANRFVIQRSIPSKELSAYQSFFFSEPESIPVVLANYYNMEDSVRNTLIALPGLTLATTRYDKAAGILRSLARYFKQGMLPDRLPTCPLQEHDYGSVDTTLWYFYALDHYLRTTNDYELLDEVYPRLVDSIDWYIRGTYNGIQVDTNDGLLRAHQPGKALTWMNATINGTPVTPRYGKTVEVNALWYHALSLMYEWSQRQQQKGRSSLAPAYYEEQSIRCQQSFQQRFWNADRNYLYDVVDGPDGDDATFRPNQLLALSLRYAVLAKEHWQAILDLVTRQLVTPYGLRTLAPREAEYCGQLKENQEEQLRALHRGSVWPWLLGPYIDAILNLQYTPPTRAQLEDKNKAYEYWWRKSLQRLEPFHKQFNEGILGMVDEVYAGDAPHYGGYKGASALSIGEILRIYNRLAREAIHIVPVVATPSLRVS